MAAPILLSQYRMKKKTLKESEIPVDMKFMREFRAEMMSRFSAQDEHFRKLTGRIDGHDARFDRVDARFDEVDAKFEQVNARFDQMEKRFDEIDKRFDQMDAKIDKAVDEMKALFHQAMLIFEEQNLRNKQAYDSAAVTYEALQDLKNSLKPEAFKDA